MAFPIKQFIPLDFGSLNLDSTGKRNFYTELSEFINSEFLKTGAKYDYDVVESFLADNGIPLENSYHLKELFERNGYFDNEGNFSKGLIKQDFITAFLFNGIKSERDNIAILEVPNNYKKSIEVEVDNTLELTSIEGSDMEEDEISFESEPAISTIKVEEPAVKEEIDYDITSPNKEDVGVEKEYSSVDFDFGEDLEEKIVIEKEAQEDEVVENSENKKQEDSSPSSEEEITLDLESIQESEEDSIAEVMEVKEEIKNSTEELDDFSVEEELELTPEAKEEDLGKDQVIEMEFDNPLPTLETKETTIEMEEILEEEVEDLDSKEGMILTERSIVDNSEDSLFDFEIDDETDEVKSEESIKEEITLENTTSVNSDSKIDEDSSLETLKDDSDSEVEEFELTETDLQESKEDSSLLFSTEDLEGNSESEDKEGEDENLIDLDSEQEETAETEEKEQESSFLDSLDSEDNTPEKSEGEFNLEDSEVEDVSPIVNEPDSIDSSEIVEPAPDTEEDDDDFSSFISKRMQDKELGSEDESEISDSTESLEEEVSSDSLVATENEIEEATEFSSETFQTKDNLEEDDDSEFNSFTPSSSGLGKLSWNSDEESKPAEEESIDFGFTPKQKSTFDVEDDGDSDFLMGNNNSNFESVMDGSPADINGKPSVVNAKLIALGAGGLGVVIGLIAGYLIF